MQGGGYQEESRRFPMCPRQLAVNASGTQPRFELILGKTGSRVAVPGKVGRDWMSTSSIQLVDRLTGKTLAEDSMYFLRYDTGAAGCPEGLKQISDLLGEVFARH